MPCGLPVLRALATCCVLSASLVAWAQPRSSERRPARDTPGQQRDRSTPAPAGRISGRVVSADTGRPVKRARVLLGAAEIPGGRGALTDDEGVFEFTELPQGRYTLTVGKSGFVGLSYGQRRPLQAGTPLQLNQGEHLRGIEFRLPRGSVISGHIFDNAGDPAPGATVRVLRYQYAQGVRQLVPAGSGQADDRGEFRVWGLNPGDYVVAAMIRGTGSPMGGPVGRGGRGRPAERAAGPGDDPASGFPGVEATRPEDSGYAPTYYPGVDSIEAAQTVIVGLSAEVLGIDFGLRLVRTATITGRVTSSEGTPVSNGTLTLTPEGLPGRPAQGTSLGGRIQGDGAFTIASVPPGRYLLRARGNDWEVPRFASTPLTVSGADMSGVDLTVAPGATITGSVSLTRSAALNADLAQFRLAAPAVDGQSLGPNPTARVDADGTFRLEGVAAGSRWIRAHTPRGWVLHSVTLDGRDVTDQPIEVTSGQRLRNVSIVFSDRLSEVSGTLTDERGTPVNDYTILAFPTDSTLWRPQARQIMTGRPDQTGTYQLRGLPAGEYLVAPIDPAEQGEWFDPSFLDAQRTRAVRVTLADGDVKTQHFTIDRR